MTEAINRICSVKHWLLKISQIFPKKTKASNFQVYLKRDSDTCFSVNFTKIWRTCFLRNTFGRLPLPWLFVENIFVILDADGYYIFEYWILIHPFLWNFFQAIFRPTSRTSLKMDFCKNFYLYFIFIFYFNLCFILKILRVAILDECLITSDFDICRQYPTNFPAF